VHIFIDEAGTFATPVRSQWSASCVGALVVKDSDVDTLLPSFAELRSTWREGEREIKGSRLDEQQVKDALDLLSRFDVFFEVVAIDMALQKAENITRHREMQADIFVKRIDERFNENLAKGLHAIREKLLLAPNQLYLQGVCTWLLVASVIRRATLYYVQRSPEELSGFHWRFDAKGDAITPFEELWTSVSLGILESISIQEPFLQLEGMDYSHFARFEKELPVPPERLREALGEKIPFQYLDSRAIFAEDRAFVRSDSNFGIQLVDILTTSIRRAMNGNLQFHGWAGLSNLMVQAGKGKQVVHLIDLSNHSKPFYGKGKPPYFRVIRHIDMHCKPMRPSRTAIG